MENCDIGQQSNEIEKTMNENKDNLPLNGYRQIDSRMFDFSYPDNRTKTILDGKTVERIGIIKGHATPERRYLIITFTDKTFVCLRATIDEDGLEILQDAHITTPKMMSNAGLVDYYDEDNTPHIKLFAQMLCEFGLWTIDEEEIKKERQMRQDLQSRLEYQEYLRLKAKFEPEDGNTEN